MGRPGVIAASVLAAAVLAGCGSGGGTPSTAGTQSTASKFPIVPAYRLHGDPKAGSAVFASAGCTTCHTLAAAHSTGTIGPDLDRLKPDYRAVTAQVTDGGVQMPSFEKSLSTKQIADVSAFVVDSTGGHAP